MALFVDGPPSHIKDLTDQDAGVVDVCRNEQIDIAVKLRLAFESVLLDLTVLTENQRTIFVYSTLLPQLRVSHVAVTPPLKLWHVYTSLALVYRDAYFTQLNDRYRAKWVEYQSLAQSAKRQLQTLGAGLVADPVSRAGQPGLTLVPASEGGGVFYYCASFVNTAGEEGTPSEIGSLTLPTGNALNVHAENARANVVGWNVYIGETPTHLSRQNDGPIALGDSWTFYPSALVVGGPSPGGGQQPNIFQAMPNLIQRG